MKFSSDPNRVDENWQNVNNSLVNFNLLNEKQIVTKFLECRTARKQVPISTSHNRMVASRPPETNLVSAISILQFHKLSVPSHILSNNSRSSMANPPMLI